VTRADAPDPRSFLPLTPHAFQVLLALADGERHGYGIILEVAARTDGIIRLRTGTLYVLLQRLSDEGLVELAPTPDRAADPRRRYYHLTDLGRAVLAAEARRLEADLMDARRKRVFGASRPQ
jgi:DNA-binding PadR family transcriptional regulator